MTDEANVDEQVDTTTALEEDTEGREEDGEENLRDMSRRLSAGSGLALQMSEVVKGMVDCRP